MSHNGLIPDIMRTLDDRFNAQYSLEIIDVTKNPEPAGHVNVYSTPTFFKQSPPPSRVIVGNLTDIMRLLTALEMSLQ